MVDEEEKDEETGTGNEYFGFSGVNGRGTKTGFTLILFSFGNKGRLSLTAWDLEWKTGGFCVLNCRIIWQSDVHWKGSRGDDFVCFNLPVSQAVSHPPWLPGIQQRVPLHLG